MENETPLVDKDFLLDKFEGKGGWTYVELPGIPMPKTPFGMLKVKGTIDGYEFSGFNLMPLGNGNLFMPVKAGIRRKINKQAPDTVHLTIYEDKTPPAIPEDLLLCMRDEEGLLEKFARYSDSRKKAFADWINSAKTQQTRIDRIARIMNMVESGEKSI